MAFSIQRTKDKCAIMAAHVLFEHRNGFFRFLFREAVTALQGAAQLAAVAGDGGQVLLGESRPVALEHDFFLHPMVLDLAPVHRPTSLRLPLFVNHFIPFASPVQRQPFGGGAPLDFGGRVSWAPRRLATRVPPPTPRVPRTARHAPPSSAPPFA